MTSHPKPNALIWLLLSVLVIALDQWSKAWVLANLPEPIGNSCEPVVVIENVWNWCRSYNKGAAFSLLADAGGWQHYLFSGLALVISAFLAWSLVRTPRGDWRNALPFSLVIGGALGNLIDRQIHGHVVDFIQWHWKDVYTYPSFNIADSAIVVGAIFLLVIGLGDIRRKPNATP